MAQPLLVGQRAKLSVTGRVAGREAHFSARVTWSVDTPIVALAPSVDTLSCFVQALSAGDCTVTASAPGLTSASAAISVIPADATELVMSVEVQAP